MARTTSTYWCHCLVLWNLWVDPNPSQIPIVISIHPQLKVMNVRFMGGGKKNMYITYIYRIYIYSSSNNHGSGEWVPPRRLSFTIGPFSTEPYEPWLWEEGYYTIAYPCTHHIYLLYNLEGSKGVSHDHIIPKLELRAFWGHSLTKPLCGVTSAEVVIICPECIGKIILTPLLSWYASRIQL